MLIHYCGILDFESRIARCTRTIGGGGGGVAADDHDELLNGRNARTYCMCVLMRIGSGRRRCHISRVALLPAIGAHACVCVYVLL